MIDSSLGSLPTLIVPEDPLNGAIEKPKTPPPVKIDEAKMYPPPKAAGGGTKQSPTASDENNILAIEPSTQPAPVEEPSAHASPRSTDAIATPDVASVTPRAPAQLAVNGPAAATSPRPTPQEKSPQEKSPQEKSPQEKSPRDEDTPDDFSIAIGDSDEQNVYAGGETSPRAVPAADSSPSNPTNAIVNAVAPAADSAMSVSPDPAPKAAAAPASVLSSKDYNTMAKRAAALAKLDRLAAGSKSVFDADMNDIGALGIGMQLYFMLTKYLSITFLCMGVIALPTIVVNYFGNGVTDKLVDPLQLAYASLGNQGVSPDIASDPKLCLPKGDIDCTWKTVNTPFTSNPETVSWLITIADCIYSTGFLLFCLVYRYHAKKAIELHSTENLTPAKYAVYVRGFPPDAKEQEILDHFNALYDPTKEDEYFPLWLSCCWGKRRKVNKALAAATKNQKAANMCVVTNVDHLAATTATNKEIYLNTWIAEVSIGHPTGGLLRTFLSMEALTRSIAETQELIQILEQEKVAAAAGAVITPMATKGGKASTKPPKKVTFKAGDQKLLTQAKEKLEKLNAAMEKKTSKIKAFKQTNATLGSPSKATAAVDPMQDGEVKVKSNAASAKRLAKAARKAATATEKAFNWDACQCAFVVFNNLESKRRCLRDYRKSTWWLPHKYQPKLLRFRSGQHRLIVEQAPEPSNILWENLEITDRGRLYRRSFTNFVTFLLLLFSCAIISGAQSAQQTFKSKMPPAGLCEWSLPQVFYGSDSFDANSKLAWDLQWDQNATCDPGTNNETRYHIAYTNGIVNAFNFTNPAVVAAGAASPVRCVDPCVSDSSATTCSTLPCFNQDLVDEGDVCETYLASHILYCLCTDALTTSMDDFGFIDGPKMLWETYTPCRGFITDYLTKNAFIVVAAGIVVIVNLLLKAILRAFANFERHSSESAKASAIAIKMFSAQFLNTAIIVLVVNATLGLNKIPLAKELFNGKYRDFEREWYPTVGMGITMTMLINAFVPQLLLFVQMFVLAPIRRCLTRRKIRTQHQMNQLYAGPQFDIAVRYPMILNSVFVTMVFCGGSPVLLFIASIAAAGTFWLDKLSLLHMYSIKTTYDEELGEIALQILPWTLVLHLGFSTWMYGNTTLMKSATIDLTALLQFFGYKATSASSDPNAVYQEFLDKATKIDILGENGFVVKVVHSNVMTVFVFFLIVLVGIFLSTLWLQVLLPILKRTLFLILQAIWKRLKPRLARATARLAWKRKKKVEKLQKSAKVAVDLPTPAEVAEAPAVTPTPLSDDGTAAPQVPASPETSPGPDPPVALAVASTPRDQSDSPTQPVASVDMPVAAADPPPEVVPQTNDDPSTPTTAPTGLGTAQLLVKKSSTMQMLSAFAAAASPRAAAKPHTVPEFTDFFRKSVAAKYRPDTRMGFAKNEAGELIRTWQDETIVNGIQRLPGEHMRTWEAMQAPVKIYAIEANSKYRLAVAELAAAAKRMRTASTVLSKIEIPHPIDSGESKQQHEAEAAMVAAISDSILATEPVTSAIADQTSTAQDSAAAMTDGKPSLSAQKQTPRVDGGSTPRAVATPALEAPKAQ